jgi:hypothetical protein
MGNMPSSGGEAKTAVANAINRAPLNNIFFMLSVFGCTI